MQNIVQKKPHFDPIAYFGVLKMFQHFSHDGEHN